MSNNCPNNTCSNLEKCQCGITLDIYEDGNLIESTNAYIALYQSNEVNNNKYFLDIDSSVWEDFLGKDYELKVFYNSRYNRWELIGYSQDLGEEVMLGSFYPGCGCDCIKINWLSEGYSGGVIGEKIGTFNGKNLYKFPTPDYYNLGATGDSYLWWNTEPLPTVYPFEYPGWIITKDQYGDLNGTINGIARNWDIDCPFSHDQDWYPFYLTNYAGIESIEACCILCPDSSTRWDLCGSFTFRIDESSQAYTVNWGGEFTNGRKSYSLTVLGNTWDFFWDGDEWVILSASGDYPDAFSSIDSICVPTGAEWVGKEGDPTTYIISSSTASGYEIKVRNIDCGCCDEEIIVTISDIYNDGTVDYIAEAVTDEYGNPLIYNDRQYYSFVYDEEEFCVSFNGDDWVIATSCGPIPLCEVVVAQTMSIGNCPYGPYTISTNTPYSEKILSVAVRGAECFDCCNYYTPRFSNFIKKKKYDLISDISDIKSKEIFGFKCGPDWSDLFRKHLILDVLHCLPYGVLCDEEEQCLINNVNENCNC